MLAARPSEPPVQPNLPLQYGQADLALFGASLFKLYLDGGWQTALDTNLRSLLTDSSPDLDLHGKNRT